MVSKQKATSEQEDINFAIYSSFEEAAELRQEWDDFVASVEGDIYLTYDWCRTWWQFYGRGRELHLFVYRYQGKLVGLIPVFSERQWLGPVWLKIVKVVGADFTLAIINPPVDPRFAKSVFIDFLVSLTSTTQCDAFRLGPTPGNYLNIQQFKEAIREQSELLLLKESIPAVCTFFPLPGNFADYLQSLDKRQQRNLRRDLNLINKSFKLTQEVIRDTALVDSEFDKFVEMHNHQWAAAGRLGHFNDWPKGAEFNAKLAEKQAGKGRLRLLRLAAGDKVVSYQLCYAFANRWYGRLPARVVGPEWNQYAWGRIGLVKMIEAAIAEGAREIEAGAGHYDYKIKLGGEEHPLCSFLLTRKQLFCRLRAFLFLKLSALLHLFYYRLWFNRLAPRLPFKRKGLWDLWIRTRM